MPDDNLRYSQKDVIAAAATASAINEGREEKMRWIIMIGNTRKTSTTKAILYRVHATKDGFIYRRSSICCKSPPK